MKTFWRVYEQISIVLWVAIALPPLIIIGILMRLLDEKEDRGQL